MSLETLGARQLDENGDLGIVRDVCVVAAQRAYLVRKESEANAAIVQMVLGGSKIPHWYFRSDTSIDQPYWLPNLLVTPYRGNVTDAPPLLYGEGTYVVDKNLTRLTNKPEVIASILEEPFDTD